MNSIWVIILIMSVITTGTTTDTTEKELLTLHIADIGYNIEDVEYNVFDCSDTSAIVENELSKKGWDARIILLSRSDKRNHAMVKVYANNTYYIECTQKRIVSDIPEGYTGMDEFMDVVAAVEQSGYGVKEWGFDVYIEQKERER